MLVQDKNYYHLNDFLIGKFGFTTQELIQGKYSRESLEIEIKDKDIAEKAAKYISFEGAPEEIKGIFGNSQILVGYNPEDGFRMFYMTEKWPVCEEVHEIFTAQGSGRDTADLVYSRFADTRNLTVRKGLESIPPAQGLYCLLQGLDHAMHLTAGVGGYPKIIYIDGSEKNPEKWVREIADGRAKLALDIVSSSEERLLDKELAWNLLDRLIFKGESFQSINSLFFAQCEDSTRLFRFLRGYPA